MSIIDLIQAEAFRLGFFLAGIAPAASPAHYPDYARWVDAGLHAGMGYLATQTAREKRQDPGLVLPQARSLLVVAMRYPSPTSLPPADDSEATGRVAAYAWGLDYHEVIPPRLSELLRLLEGYFGEALVSRSYTDTGPILERDFAQSAGLGWMGKNTCLISPRHGSYFLLGESLLRKEIEPSAPFTADRCGDCRRCIDACPTGCILPDRTLDSARCISYLTIEHKGPIPADLRPKLGDWVFGCDVCQMVCPWNLRFSTPEGHPALEPLEAFARPVLRREIRLSPPEFNRKFKRSPIRRARRRGYLRNVAVALGNRKDPAALPDLAAALETEPEPLVRSHAAWALGRLDTRASRIALEASLKKEPDESVRREILSALEDSTPQLNA